MDSSICEHLQDHWFLVELCVRGLDFVSPRLYGRSYRGYVDAQMSHLMFGYMMTADDFDAQTFFCSFCVRFRDVFSDALCFVMNERISPQKKQANVLYQGSLFFTVVMTDITLRAYLN